MENNFHKHTNEENKLRFRSLRDPNVRRQMGHFSFAHYQYPSKSTIAVISFRFNPLNQIIPIYVSPKSTKQSFFLGSGNYSDILKLPFYHQYLILSSVLLGWKYTFYVCRKHRCVEMEIALFVLYCQRRSLLPWKPQSARNRGSVFCGWMLESGYTWVKMCQPGFASIKIGIWFWHMSHVSQSKIFLSKANTTRIITQ